MFYPSFGISHSKPLKLCNLLSIKQQNRIVANNKEAKVAVWQVPCW